MNKDSGAQLPFPSWEENPTISVSELSRRIKNLLEPHFREVWVRGEISNLKPSGAGHLYFSLKDSEAMISAAWFGFAKRRPKFELKDGLEVVCKARVGTYALRGSYQLIVESIEPMGIGALRLAFEQLKEKLRQEGLFALERKRPLPLYPKAMAVVTSPTGAALRDVLHVLRRRSPQLEILIFPCLVQGEVASLEIVRAIEKANRWPGLDLILVTRGGGSMEDLWCFNDERVARAIANSRLPVASGVGHEIDHTICDFVSDYRAPTPSAAAEIISRGWWDTRENLKHLRQKLGIFLRHSIDAIRVRVRNLEKRLINPKARLEERIQRCDELTRRLSLGLERYLSRRREACLAVMGKLDSLSPLRVLNRGYGFVTSSDGKKVIDSIDSITIGNEYLLGLKDGEATVEAKRFKKI